MNNPDFIWAVFEEDISAQTCEVYAQCEPEGFVNKPTKYIREDIAETSTRIKELERERDELQKDFDGLDAASRTLVNEARSRAEAAEAKLHKAVAALRHLHDLCTLKTNTRETVRTTLAELEGK